MHAVAVLPIAAGDNLGVYILQSRIVSVPAIPINPNVIKARCSLQKKKQITSQPNAAPVIYSQDSKKECTNK